MSIWDRLTRRKRSIDSSEGVCDSAALLRQPEQWAMLTPAQLRDLGLASLDGRVARARSCTLQRAGRRKR
jgi:hypothetical protein